MNLTRYATTGLVGSGALTGLHQAMKVQKDSPRVDLLGKQAVEKILGGKKSTYSDRMLYRSTLAADIIGNALFYGIIAKTRSKIFTGILVGALYGTGTLLLPKVLGLRQEFVSKPDKRRYLTIGYYAFGGLMAGIAASIFRGSMKSSE